MLLVLEISQLCWEALNFLNPSWRGSVVLSIQPTRTSSRLLRRTATEGTPSTVCWATWLTVNGADHKEPVHFEYIILKSDESLILSSQTTWALLLLPMAIL